MNVMLRRDGYPIVPLSDAEREARDPLVRRQKELQQQREEEERRKARAPRHQRDEQLQSAESWRAWAIAIADERIAATMDRGGLIHEVVAMAIADERDYMHGRHDKIRAEIAALRDELKATTAKLHERLAPCPASRNFNRRRFITRAIA